MTDEELEHEMIEILSQIEGPQEEKFPPEMLGQIINRIRRDEKYEIVYNFVQSLKR